MPIKGNVSLTNDVDSMIFQSSSVVNMPILRCGFLLQIMYLPLMPKLSYSIDNVLRCACVYGLSHDSHMILISICF